MPEEEEEEEEEFIGLGRRGVATGPDARPDARTTRERNNRPRQRCDIITHKKPIVESPDRRRRSRCVEEGRLAALEDASRQAGAQGIGRASPHLVRRRTVN